MIVSYYESREKLVYEKWCLFCVFYFS